MTMCTECKFTYIMIGIYVCFKPVLAPGNVLKTKQKTKLYIFLEYYLINEFEFRC